MNTELSQQIDRLRTLPFTELQREHLIVFGKRNPHVTRNKCFGDSPGTCRPQPKEACQSGPGHVRPNLPPAMTFACRPFAHHRVQLRTLPRTERTHGCHSPEQCWCGSSADSESPCASLPMGSTTTDVSTAP